MPKPNGKITANGKIYPVSPQKLRRHLIFFREAWRDFEHVASIFPSSRFLERRLIKMSRLDTAHTIVELGAGTGGTTLAILRAMPSAARLLSIEINPSFHQVLQHINDPRLISHLGSADTLQAILQQYQLPAPDVIFSGIPFSRIDENTGRRILKQVAEVLAPGGRFVAYQLRSQVQELGGPFLGEAQQIRLELLNIPPLRVFQWEK